MLGNFSPGVELVGNGGPGESRLCTMEVVMAHGKPIGSSKAKGDCL